MDYSTRAGRAATLGAAILVRSGEQYQGRMQPGNGKDERAMSSLPASYLLCKLQSQRAGDQDFGTITDLFSSSPKFGMKSDFPRPEEALTHK